MKREERAQLAAVIEEIRGWVSTGESVGQHARHMPLSGSLMLQPEGDSLLNDLAAAESSGDLDTATPLLKARLLDGRKKFAPAHEAARRLTAFHQFMHASGRVSQLEGLAQHTTEQHALERAELDTVLTALRELSDTSATTLVRIEHMPLTRKGVLSDAEHTAMTALIQLLREHEHASGLLSGEPCSEGTCPGLHTSARTLREVRKEAESSGTADVITKAASRVAAQFDAERRRLRDMVERIDAWPSRVDAIRTPLQQAKESIDQRVKALYKGDHVVTLNGTRIRLAPVVAPETTLMKGLVLLRNSLLTREVDQQLTAALQRVDTRRLKQAYDDRWECPGDNTCLAAHDTVTEIYPVFEEIEEQLGRLQLPPRQGSAGVHALLAPDLAFTAHLPATARHPRLIDAQLTEHAKQHIGTILRASKAAKEAARRAEAAGENVRADDVMRALKAMDLEVLKRASTGAFRISALRNAGLENVWDVYKLNRDNHDLEALPGIGARSALAISQAALRLHQGVREETPVRINVKTRAKRTTALLAALRDWDAVRRFEPSPEEVLLTRTLSAVLKEKPKTTHILVMNEGSAIDGADVPAMLGAALERAAPQELSSDDIWTDFLSRPADFFGMLNELGFVTEDEKKMHGDLPQEIVEAVRAIDLKTTHLKASLRAYQSFGARFVLAQKKVVIGDEMGLGKTVEALAVLAHLHATGRSHYIVVCPAAVVSNWVRESSHHTTLPVTRIHGAAWERKWAASSWKRHGGVAVTTFDLLSDLLPQIEELEIEVSCAIFDEAHYIKNPAAKRSQAAAALLEEVPFAALMSGTPMENRVDEFRHLIGYIRPDLSEEAPDYLPSTFRKHVAPAYLRRNQEDVLTELPELVEVDEWLTLSPADQADYRSAVEASHFMKMRRAAMLSVDSNKLSRLMDIVEEAEDNNRRVIVFSYFREVLDVVAAALPGSVFGPLTGSTPAVERQALVDRFSEAPHGAALVAQITAGGVGLNIQSASVVVICEPQLKPTMETQAIARAHRMGQINTVQVHRLLTEESVDERIVEILSEKRRLFDDFARDSVIAEQAPDALDVSDAELARMVIAAERERLLGEPAASS